MGALATSSAILTWRLYKVKRAGKKWWSRQKRVVTFMSTQLVIQLVNATLYLAPNAYYLTHYDSCPWHLLPINVFGFIRWTCWAAVSPCFECAVCAVVLEPTWPHAKHSEPAHRLGWLVALACMPSASIVCALARCGVGMPAGANVSRPWR